MSAFKEYLNNLPSRGSRLGLARVLELLGLLASPQESLPIIHIAGTNGKGSVSAMLESILCRCGYKTGFFTSPSLGGVNGLFRVNKECISDERLCQVTEKIMALEKNMAELPTEYEVYAAIALEFFRQEGCDAVILETCMGGRLDATNVAKKPLLSVITDVDLDHTGFLGNTVKEIAKEKAGIIKAGCPVVFGGNNSDAMGVIKAAAHDRGSRLVLVDKDQLSNIRYSLMGTEFDFGELKNIRLSICGAYQPHNAAVVLTAVELLKDMGFNISEDNLRKGLAEVKWQGRFELLSMSPVIIYDGSHNPGGMEMTVHSIREYFGGRKVNLLMGVMADKDYSKMVEIISPLTERVVTVTPNNPRALSSADLARRFEENNVSAFAAENISDGVKTAVKISKKTDTPLLIIGSLYMYSDVVNILDSAF